MNKKKKTNDEQQCVVGWQLKAKCEFESQLYKMIWLFGVCIFYPFFCISLCFCLYLSFIRVVVSRFQSGSFPFQTVSTNINNNGKEKNCICLVAVWMRLLWTFNYDWCLLLCDKLYRCGGVCVVGANVPQLQLIRICVNVPKGCLQISFLTVWMPWMRLLCRMYWAFSGCVNLVDFVADRFHRWCI